MKEDLCKAFDTKAEDYLADALSPEEKARFDEHLAGCASCQKTLERAEGLDRCFSVLREPAPSVLLDGVMASVRRETAAKRRVSVLGKFLPMVACLAIMVSVILMVPNLMVEKGKGDAVNGDFLPQEPDGEVSRDEDDDKADSVLDDGASSSSGGLFPDLNDEIPAPVLPNESSPVTIPFTDSVLLPTTDMVHDDEEAETTDTETTEPPEM